MTNTDEQPVRPISRRKRWIFRLITVLLIYLVVELVASQMGRLAPRPKRVEWAVASIREGRPPWRYVPHPYTFFTPKPNYVDWFDVKQHNSLGFRGAEFPVAKPPGVFRVVCLGDSTTYSTGTDVVAEAYPAQLELFLRSETGNESIQVINGGYPSASTAEVLQTLAFRVVPLAPDLLVVSTGINDAHMFWWPNHQLDYSHQRKRFVLPEYDWLTRGLLHSPTYRIVFTRTELPYAMFDAWGVGGSTAGPPPTLDPIAFRTNLESLILIARGRGIRIMLVNVCLQPESAAKATLGETLARFNRATDELSRKHGVPVCRFERFECPKERWVTEFHLGKNDLKRKAAFVGRDILAHKLVPVAVRRNEGATTREGGHE